MERINLILIILCFLIIIICIFKRVNDTNILSNKEDISLFNFLKENKKRTPKMVFDLAEMYYKGIDEKITPKGYIQKGVENNEKLALKYYYQLLNNKKYRDICLFRIAEIYNNSEKFKNLEKSKKLYILLLNSSIVDLKMNSFERIQNINRELNLPILQDLVFLEDNFPINTQQQIEIQQNREIPDFVIESIRNDSQNVHDSTVIKTLKNKLNSLEKTELDNNQCYNDIKNIIINCNKYTGNKFKISQNKINRALENLDKMYSINTYITSLECNEKDVLLNVYKKYTSMNKEEQKNFVNNLVLQLSDEKNICAQGRVSRVLTSIDTSEDIKPLWVIRQEMMNKAPMLRKELMIKENLDETIIDNPKSLTEEHISELFEKEFKYNLKKLFEKDYVETGILSKEALEKELDSWLI